MSHVLKSYLSPTQKDGQCHAVWMLCYAALAAKDRTPTAEEIGRLGEALGLNPGNVAQEYHNWRRANNLTPTGRPLG